MYRELTVKHSLYNIDSKLLEEFKQYPLLYSELTPKFNITHPQLDTWAATFNNWLLFISEEEKLIIDHSKTFSHSINILCTNEIEKSDNYLLIVDRFNRQQRYIIACFLTNELHNWKLQVMQKNKLQDVLTVNLENDNYYKLSNIEFVRIHPRIQQIFIHQSKLVKALIRDIQSTNRFEHCIKKSIHDSRAFLRYRKRESNLVE